MEIDIELFKKKFQVKIELNNIDNYIKNEHNKLYKIVPFKGSKNPEYIITSFENVVNAYIMNICGTKKVNLSKDDLIKKTHSEIICNEESQEFLNQVISNIFFNEEENINTSNISLNEYKTCTNTETEIGNFIADIMGNKENIANIINNNSENYSYNALEEFFLNLIKNTSIKNKLNKKEYIPLVLYMQDVFLEDIQFLMSNRDLANQHTIELLELYYFNYISQLSFILNKFLRGTPNEYTKFYYALDWETMSKTREASTSFSYISRDINTLFSHAILLEILNTNSLNVSTNYYTLSEDLKNNITKDEEYASKIKQVSDIYISCLKLPKESLNSLHDSMQELKSSASISTKTELELRYLFNGIYKSFEGSDKKSINNGYVNQFMSFCKNKKCKKRGSLGFVLNISQNDLIFLTKLSVGQSQTKRLTDVFFEFERRGIYLDKNSRNEVIKFYEKLNIIEKKSDSGDALYVKRIL